MKTPGRFLLLFVLLATANLVSTAGAEAAPEERSPFDGVRWTETGPQVEVSGTWYELVSLDDRPFADVVVACRKLDPRRWEKRFCEDLVAALAGVGHDLGPTVTLVVRKPGTKEVLRLPDVPATAEKRQRIRNARPWQRMPKPPPKRVTREHGTEVPKALAYLQLRFHDDDKRRVSQTQAHEDLDELEWLVRHTWSYAKLKPVDWPVAFDVVRAGIDERGISLKDFHIQMRKLIALGGDGHARVSGISSVLPRGWLPFALAEADGRVVAVRADGSPYDAKHPYVRGIGGVDIDTYLDVAARVHADGSAVFRRGNGTRYGLFSTWMEAELGSPPIRSATLEGEAGTKQVRWDAPSERPVRYRGPRRRAIEDLGGGIRYVRIPSMERDVAFLTRIGQGTFGDPMPKALVLDVRGNGGGTRDALRLLLPRFLAADATPVVCNLGAYRLPPGESFDRREGNLGNRYLFPVGRPRWTDAERAVLTKALASHAELPGGLHRGEGFTPLHGMVLSPTPQEKSRMTGPIAILIDGGCFSATDIFVGALETLPQVTLIGTPTGGGSGRSRGTELAHSGIRVRLSSMVSYRPNGSLYDGVGIAPDIEVQPTLDDLAGKTDTQLARAITELKKTLK